MPTLEELRRRNLISKDMELQSINGQNPDDPRLGKPTGGDMGEIAHNFPSLGGWFANNESDTNLAVVKAVYEFIGTLALGWFIAMGAWFSIVQATSSATISDEEITDGSFFGGFILTFPFGGIQAGDLDFDYSADTDFAVIEIGLLVAISRALIYALGYGVALAIAGYYTADLDPIYTFFSALYPRKENSYGFNFLIAFAKIVGQILGFLAGFGIAYALLTSAAFPPTPAPLVGLSDGFSFGIEALCIFWLAVVRTLILVNPKYASSVSPASTLVAVYLVCVLVATPWTGGVLNFGRYLGHAIWNNSYPKWGIYLLSSLAGNALGTLVGVLLRTPTDNVTPGSDDNF